MSNKITRHYFFEDESRTIFHTSLPREEITHLTYMGTSDNPNPKMAAAVFMQQGKALTGCKIKEYTEE